MPLFNLWGTFFFLLQIAEAGEDSLPPWMHFNEELKALQGIAGADDIGRQFLLEVTAISHFTNDTLSHAKDIFAVNVAEDSTHAQTTATPLKVTTAFLFVVSANCVIIPVYNLRFELNLPVRTSSLTFNLPSV